MEGKEQVRIAAVADIHCSRNAQGKLQPFFKKMQEKADAVLLCGDLTDYGGPEEAHVLAKEFSASIHLPTFAVLGNHDYESGKEKEICSILTDAGIRILDGNTAEIEGIGIAGVKGFAGGFGSRELQPWGEPSIKAFVGEAVDEALKLESALSRLGTEKKIVMLHYSPILETLEGEPPEIYPFLGSSRLEEAVNRYDVMAVFHGHAHYGRPEGTTLRGIPVYNVAVPVLRRAYPERPPFMLFTVNLKEVNHAQWP